MRLSNKSSAIGYVKKFDNAAFVSGRNMSSKGWKCISYRRQDERVEHYIKSLQLREKVKSLIANSQY